MRITHSRLLHYYVTINYFKAQIKDTKSTKVVK